MNSKMYQLRLSILRNRAERMKKNKESLKNLTEATNIHIMQVSERGKKWKGEERIFEETMAETFPNRMKTLIYTSKELIKLQVR